MASTTAMGQFTNISSQLYSQGVNPTNQPGSHGSGISFYDFNNDGWDDLTISGTNAPKYFLQNNNGTLELTQITLPGTHVGIPQSMIWIDFDNDGDADFFASHQHGPLELWENDGDFNFTNITAQAGLETDHYRYSYAAWGDYNHDGYADLYVTLYYSNNFTPFEEYSNKLYRNNGDGTFTNVTAEAGLLIPSSMSLQPVWADFNNDGWEDLFLVEDRVIFPNELFINNQDGTFTRTTFGSGIDEYFDAMSGSIADYNQDGWLDIFVSNNPYQPGNRLYENNGDGSFTNVAEAMGVSTMQECWGAVWFDHDNNTLEDLFVGTVDLSPDNNFFYVNTGDQEYIELANASGFNAPVVSTYNCARGDLNNDGFFDLALSNYAPYAHEVYMNQTGSKNWLSVTLEGTLANRDGLGTWIRCYVDGECYVKYTLNSENLGGQNSRKNIFGLNSATQVDSLVLEWNSGTREVYPNPEINTHHLYIEGASFTQPFEVQNSGSTSLCPDDSLVLTAGAYQSYLWNTGDTTQTIVVYQPGEYSVEVENEFGLSVSSFPVMVTAAPQTEVILNVVNISCSGASDGVIDMSFSTGTPNSITWSTGVSDTILSNLSEGIYSFSGSDQYGCTVTGEAYVSAPPPLLAQVTVEDVLCFGASNGSATQEVIGGIPPYSFNWNGSNPDALSAGNYTALATDANGCQVEVAYTVSQPDSLWIILDVEPATVGDNGSVAGEIFGGTPPYSIVWSTGDTDTLNLSNLPVGSYSVSVSDGNNCITQTNFEVGLGTGINLVMNDRKPFLYPNPNTGQFRIYHCPASEVDIEIFNASGQSVFKERSVECGSLVSAGALPAGLYSVVITHKRSRYITRILMTK